MPEATDFTKLESRYIEMPSGKRFYLSNPEFDLEDIAETLGGQDRWNGTFTRNEHDVQMTVAEHQTRGSYMIFEYEESLLIEQFGSVRAAALCAHTHDVPEFVLGDVPGPWKSVLPDFVKLEAYVWKHWVEFVEGGCGIRLPLEMPQIMREVDWRLLLLEAREGVQSQGRDWEMIKPEWLPQQSDAPLYRWGHGEAAVRWLERFYELTFDTRTPLNARCGNRRPAP